MDLRTVAVGRMDQPSVLAKVRELAHARVTEGFPGVKAVAMVNF